MANIFKRSAERATSSRPDIFARARIKLAALYIGIIAIILAVFSLALYVNFSEHLRSDFDKRPAGYSISGSEEGPAEDALEKLSSDILTADIIVLALAGILSYLLAGYTLRPIREALNAQMLFSAEASHELRTPLSIMRADIEVLLKSEGAKISGEAKKVMQSNLEEISAMTLMTEDLLDLSRGEKRLLKNAETLNLKDLALEAKQKLSDIAANKKISLDILESEDAQIFGNKQELLRAINNLVINSLAFTPPQGTISLQTRRRNGFSEISVKDTGIGIPEKDLPHIFKPFYKVNRKTNGEREGTGLGLAIVRQAVEMHKGSIQIQSQENKGTAVTISIPSAK